MSSYLDRYVLKKDYTLNTLNPINPTNPTNPTNLINTNDTLKKTEDINIYDISINKLIMQSGGVYVNLINDLSEYFSKENDKNLNKLGYILTKDTNLLYIGILFLVISFFLWLVNITS
jgi:hypothetical protein